MKTDKEKIINGFLRNGNSGNIEVLLSKLPWNRAGNTAMAGRLNGLFFGLVVLAVGLVFGELVPQTKNLFFDLLLPMPFMGFPFLLGAFFPSLSFLALVWPPAYFLIFKPSPKSIFIYFLLNFLAGCVFVFAAYAVFSDRGW